MKYLFLPFIVLLITSCTFYEPEYRGGESVQMGQLKGKELTLSVSVDLYNENKFGITVKPSTLDVYLEDTYIGKVHLDEKFKMKRKSVTRITAPLTITLENGVLFKLIRLANQKKIKVRINGDVKTSVLLLTKKLPVDETKTINGINLNL